MESYIDFCTGNTQFSFDYWTFVDAVTGSPCMPEIHDIAIALSRMPRYTGHGNRSYSIAEHSVWCSHIVPTEFALEALLHDAHESVVGDMNSPLKSLCPDYKQIEKRVERTFRNLFALPERMSPEVKTADLQMLMFERAELLPNSQGGKWDVTVGIKEIEPYMLPEFGIKCYNEFKASRLFVERYWLLKELRDGPKKQSRCR